MDPHIKIRKGVPTIHGKGVPGEQRFDSLKCRDRAGGSLRFRELAELAEGLAGEGSKLKKRAAIAAVIRRVAGESASEAGRFCLYLAGQAFAEADRRKQNAGGAILSRVLKEIAGSNDAALNMAYRRHGDMGAAAFDLLNAVENGK